MSVDYLMEWNVLGRLSESHEDAVVSDERRSTRLELYNRRLRSVYADHSGSGASYIEAITERLTMFDSRWFIGAGGVIDRE